MCVRVHLALKNPRQGYEGMSGQRGDVVRRQSMGKGKCAKNEWAEELTRDCQNRHREAPSEVQLPTVLGISRSLWVARLDRRS